MQISVRNKAYLRIIISVILTIPLVANFAYPDGPSDPNCMELGNCNFFSEPFTNMLLPFQFSLGSYVYPAIWGIIIFVIWSGVENPFIPAIIGVGLAVFMQGLFTDQQRLVGYGLLALAIATAFFQIVTLKPHYPSN